MPYNIELMCIGFDGYDLLQSSSRELLRIQQQFTFGFSLKEHQTDGLNLKRDEYEAKEIFEFLNSNRQKHGGKRPYIIAFVDKPLSGLEYNNLFGSHRASEGLAIVTVNDFHQFVKEAERYCQYYIVRYCLSFINPEIRVHNRIEDADCYFHQKIYKPDIRRSMDTGKLCVRCLKQLENPKEGGIGNKLSSAERDALAQMRDFVAGQLPYGLVLKGGGVKGLAYAGALIELERYFSFDKYIGTSAGAIAAVLLAAGYDPAELSRILKDKDLREFLDSPVWQWPFNLLFRRGLHKGDTFINWLHELLSAKLGERAYFPMSELSSALIFASRRNQGAIAFDSEGTRSDSDAVHATRCSMSIPFLFTSPTIDGIHAYDGGIRANFPIKEYLRVENSRNFIAIYLSEPVQREGSFLGDLLNIGVEGEERQLLDEFKRDIIVINTWPIDYKNFSISKPEKEFLFAAGRAAALRFLFNRSLDNGPSDEVVISAENDADELRKLVS